MGMFVKKIAQLCCRYSLLLKIALVLSIALLAYFSYLTIQISSKFDGQRWHLPAQIYSQAKTLYPQAPVSHEQMLHHLKRLGYQKVRTPSVAGEFSASKDKIQVWRREFFSEQGFEESQQALIHFTNDGVSQLTQLPSHRPLGFFQIEPELLDRLMIQTTEDRVFVKLDHVPQSLIKTLLLVEDRDYYHHIGVNFFAILRAVWANVQAGHTVQGGSTLTQQLVKNFFLTRERSLLRKLKEASIAVVLNARYSKEEILEAYLNEVFMGQDRQRAIHGFGLAAHYYFNRPLEELDIVQQATLVALIKGPSFYQPWKHPQRVLKRRNLILKMMYEQNMLRLEQYSRLADVPLRLRDKQQPWRQKLPAFYTQVKKELQQRYGRVLMNASGLKVFTTLDPLAQEAAEKAVVEQLPRLIRRTGYRDLQVGFVVTDRYTGGISAMVGDRNPAYSGFNRASEIRRPIGSLVKPFVYLTALMQPERYHLMTQIADEPFELKQSNGVLWQPQNYDKQFLGQVPLWNALVKSRNIPTVNLGMDVGIGSVKATLEQAGWSEPIASYPSMLLGALNGSPWMVAQIYQTVADNGFYRPLHTISAVLDHENRVIPTDSLERTPAWIDSANYLIQHALTQVVRKGTARSLYWAYPKKLLAGKTGTSNAGRDAWFAGFDAAHVAAIWVGRDTNAKTNLYGSNSALAVYKSFLKSQPPMSLQLRSTRDHVTGYFEPNTGLAVDADCYGAIPVPVMRASWQSGFGCRGLEQPRWWSFQEHAPSLFQLLR